MNKTGIINLGLLALTSSITITGNAAVVINEIDYDQPGTDTAEFIELFNSGASTVALDGYIVELINGSNSSVYRSIDLSGFNISASGYFVMCGDASQIANCDYSFTTTNSWLQNGAPEAIGLYQSDNLLDSLSYEGELQPLTEGTALTIADNSSDITSLSRIPNGFDSNDNNFDFQLGCITPGSANVAGTGDCSVQQVSAVPIPAAAWLFASGMIGLAGFARRE